MKSKDQPFRIAYSHWRRRELAECWHHVDPSILPPNIDIRKDSVYLAAYSNSLDKFMLIRTQFLEQYRTAWYAEEYSRIKYGYDDPITVYDSFDCIPLVARWCYTKKAFKLGLTEDDKLKIKIVFKNNLAQIR